MKEVKRKHETDNVLCILLHVHCVHDPCPYWLSSNWSWLTLLLCLNATFLLASKLASLSSKLVCQGDMLDELKGGLSETRAVVWNAKVTKLQSWGNLRVACRKAAAVYSRMWISFSPTDPYKLSSRYVALSIVNLSLLKIAWYSPTTLCRPSVYTGNKLNTTGCLKVWTHSEHQFLRKGNTVACSLW